MHLADRYSAIISYQLLQQNARDEVIENARIMMESAIAVRNYTVGEIRPLLAMQQKRQFIKQTVPAYAANQYIAKLQDKHPDYNYREATLNPTNPRNIVRHRLPAVGAGDAAHPG